MNFAKIVKENSLPSTLRSMPIGEEQVIPSKVFSTEQVRRAASDLKKFQGFEFIVKSFRNLSDTYVTRTK